MLGLHPRSEFPGFPSGPATEIPQLFEDFGAKPTMDVWWTYDANALFEGEGLDPNQRKIKGWEDGVR